ncbi:MAG: hypothetical protein ACLUSP_06080 [Christensenellales bacterium]
MKFFDMSKYNDYPKPLRKGKYPFIICMLSLSIISFAVFYLGVNIQSILLAFKKFTGYATDGSEIYVWSWDNFRNIFLELSGGGTSSTQLLQAFKNSLFLFFAGNGVTIPTGCFISYYLWKKMRGYSFFRVIFYLPVILSSVVMVIMFRSFIAPNGFWARSISQSRRTRPAVAQSGRFGDVVRVRVQHVGRIRRNVSSSYAALHRIPADVIESAQLDGITPAKEFSKSACRSSGRRFR